MHGLYRVVGARSYQGVRPGETFEALLDPAAEKRAIARGSIELIHRVSPSLAPANFQMPEGWNEEASRLTTNGGRR